MAIEMDNEKRIKALYYIMQSVEVRFMYTVAIIYGFHVFPYMQPLAGVYLYLQCVSLHSPFYSLLLESICYKTM